MKRIKTSVLWGNKEQKAGFGREQTPCGQSHANAGTFRIAVIETRKSCGAPMIPGRQGAESPGQVVRENLQKSSAAWNRPQRPFGGVTG